MVSIISMMLHLLVVALLLLMLSSSFPAAVIVVVEAQGFDDSIAATCNLCEDGSPLPDPNMDMGRNQTCQTLQQDFIDENEYICVRVQGTKFADDDEGNSLSYHVVMDDILSFDDVSPPLTGVSPFFLLSFFLSTSYPPVPSVYLPFSFFYKSNCWCTLWL